MGQATGAVHGYLVADQARNDSGKFSGLAYVVNEIPVPPQTDNPAPAKPAPANPPLVSTELLVSTEKAAKGSPDGSQGEDGIFDQVATFSSIHSSSSNGTSESLPATSAATMDSSNIPPPPRKESPMAAKKPATKSADAQAAKPKSRAARKPAAPRKPAKHPVTAASEPAPVELSPLEQLLAQMGPRHVEFVWQCLVRLNATRGCFRSTAASSHFRASSICCRMV